MNIILDACAVISFFRHEEGGDIVEEFLIRPDCNSYIHAINLCEVYSDFIRSNNQVYADLKPFLHGDGDKILGRLLLVSVNAYALERNKKRICKEM